ncbi:MAG: M14 family zinc carboxypeptidase [Anaerolineae bacterium]|nr:M14 family zinc carboxypeptidase [Anaerolineae bacterium]
MSYRHPIRLTFLMVLCVLLLMVTAPVAAGRAPEGRGAWWDVIPEEENPSSQYDSILYSEIAPKLREIEVNSNRVQVEVIGQSAGGRDLYLATVSAPEAMGRLGQYQAIRKMMLTDPEKAQEMIDRFGDFKVPVFINGSIHGTEYPGVDAAIRLIETLAFDDSEEVQMILENVILLVNVVQNPDGRVMGTRSNANGFDINRDFITQSQPESQATVRIMTEWNPMVVLDLHGFVNPMLIEPCTPPHNPNYEYDLYIRWALAQAEAMESELLANTGFAAQIPYRDFALGWDDWPPTYTPMYGMYHGAYGHTLETPYRDERGVDAHYWAVWGALKFAAENREAMVHDQIEIFRRGFLGLLQQPIPPELLPEFPQYEELIIQEFPTAYVIPRGEPWQTSEHQVARLVEFLLFNDVQVEQAVRPFTVDGVEYPAGSYVVWLTQPKRGLANTILDEGLDLSYIPDLFFYSPPSVWSQPFLWGVYRAEVAGPLAVTTVEIGKADAPRGSIEGNRAGAYAYYPSSITAIQATNALLVRGETLYRAHDAFADRGRDFRPGAIIVPGNPALANELANGYALDVVALDGVPDGAVALREQRIAAAVDNGGLFLLRRLGFEYDVVTRGDLNGGFDLSGYDVFINNGVHLGRLNPTGDAAVLDFFAAGGDYIGLGDWGADLAAQAGLLSFSTDYSDGNSIVRIDYAIGDGLSAGFQPEGYAFMNDSAYFFDLEDGVTVAATINDSAEFLVSGFWPGWQESGAAGLPVVIHNAEGEQDTALIGFDATFRAHPEDSFRLVANAIYAGID